MLKSAMLGVSDKSKKKPKEGDEVEGIDKGKNEGKNVEENVKVKKTVSVQKMEERLKEEAAQTPEETDPAQIFMNKGYRVRVSR
jgi:hypothetical protein